MKIELDLFSAGRTWRGMTLIDGNMFKVTLFPGSATQEWGAELGVSTFVELDEEKAIFSAIKRAYEGYINLSHGLTQDEENRLVELIENNPEAMREIQEVLNWRGDGS